MKYRKGVFAVVYHLENSQPFYLLLKRHLHWKGWEFPKGGLEPKENLIDGARRELKEETGLKPMNLKKFNHFGKYDYDKELDGRDGFKGQTFEALYAVEIKPSQKDKVEIDEREHTNYNWVSYEKAIKNLTWPNQKESLAIVHEYLVGKKYTGFRKTITSSGKLLLAGKTEANNEQLVKTHVKPGQIVLHTVARGSPFVIIKSEDTPTKQDIKEAAIFCAKHSHDWRDNKKDVLVHYFKGKDIYKDKSMRVGTFGVKGSKEIKVKKGELQ